MSDGGIIGQAYGRKIHAREVVAIDEAGDGLCWVLLTRFGDDWLLIRSDARDVSRAVRKLRQIPAGEQPDRDGLEDRMIERSPKTCSRYVIVWAVLGRRWGITAGPIVPESVCELTPPCTRKLAGSPDWGQALSGPRPLPRA